MNSNLNCPVNLTKSMIADLVIDFDFHLDHGKVWLVELQLPILDAPDDVPSHLDADVYVVANNQNQATYIAQCMYPDALGAAINESPVTREQYAARRNRSIH